MVPFAGPANPVDATAQVINDWPMFTKSSASWRTMAASTAWSRFLAHMGTMPGSMARLKPAFLEVRQRFPDRVFILCARMPRDMADEFTATGFLIFEDPTRAIIAVAALSRLARALRASDARAGGPAATPLAAGPITRPRQSGCSLLSAFRSPTSTSRERATRRLRRRTRSAFRSC